MSITIEGLDIQIKSSAGSAAQNIDELAKSLGRLNANAKVTKITNSLTSLNKSLSEMRSNYAVIGELSKLSQGLAKLGAIPKLTGLQSAIRELKKLPEVMASLDAAQIAQFTGKIKLLATGLGPLATQIDKIGRGFSKLPPQVSKCVTAVKRLDNANKSAAKSAKDHGSAVNAQSVNLLTAYENLSNVFSMLHGVQDAAAKVLNDAIQWDGIQFQFGRAFGEDAEEVLEYAEKVSDALKINQQQFMESASLYGSLLKGFGVEQKQVTTMAVGLAELSYDIWAAYNNRYKTLDDASEAVRSAITGEIEPIRNAGIALTEASMQEFADGYNLAAEKANDVVTALEEVQGKASEVSDMVANGISAEMMQATADTLGLGMSIEKMTEAQKSELRYATMVNAAMNQGIIGTYAREMNTAEGAVRTLTQQLKTLGQAFGSLFIPVLKAVLPWISAFVELLTEGLIALGAMFGIEFQKLDWSNSTGMAQTADSANATKNALGEAADEAKKLKSYTMGFDELNVINPGSDSGAGAGAGGVSGATGGGLGLDLETLWDNAVFESASKQVDELKEKIKAYVEEHKVMLTVVGSVAAFLTLAKAIRGLNAILGITKTFSNLVSIFTGLGKAATFLAGAFANVKAFFQLLQGGSGFLPTLAAAFPKVANAFTTLGSAASGALSAIGGIFGASGGAAIAAGAAVVVAAIVAVVSVVTFLKRNWEEVTAAVKGFFETNIVPKLESIKESFNNIKAALPEGVVLWFENVIGKVKEFFESGKLLDGIGKAFEVLGGVIFSVVGGSIATAFSTIMQLLQGVIGWFSGVIQYVTGFAEFWIALFTGGDLVEPLQKMWDGIVNIFKGMYDVTIGIVVNFVKSIIDWFTNLWDELVGHSIVPDMINGIVDWFLSLPQKVLQPLKTFCDSVKQKFVELWDSVKAWFNINVAPKFTAYFWLTKFEGIKEGFKLAIKNAVNAGIGLMNKFIGWVNEKMSFSWEAVKVAGKEIVPAGSIQLFTIPEIPKLEKGGFLEDGLFTMNRGEIAGKFNNGKSVVANNQQIVEGIAAGVYEAVVAAMNATSGRGEQSVNVYLDGKQITAAVEKRQNERGRTLMGNQLGYVY